MGVRRPRALEIIPEDGERIIALHIEGLKHREIAAQLGCSLTTVGRTVREWRRSRPVECSPFWREVGL